MVRERILTGMILLFLTTVLSVVMYGCGSNGPATPINQSVSTNSVAAGTATASNLPNALLTNFNAYSISNTPNSITLAWPIIYYYNNPVNRYVIYKFNSGAVPIEVARTPGNSYTITGLQPNTQYIYNIVAYWAPQFGSPITVAQSPWIYTTTLGSTSSPASVSVQPGDTQNHITWAPVTGATSYKLYWSTNSDLSLATTNKITGVTSTYVHTGLTNGTTYYYAVSAISANGESVKSATVSATPQLSPPVAPTNITAVTQSTSQININWTLVFNATGYNIYRSTTPNFVVSSTNKIATVPIGPFFDAGLTSNTTYYYKIIAVNAAGWSPVSTEVSAKTAGIPAAPTGVTATTIGANQIDINWTASQYAAGYNIYRSTSPGVVITAANKINASPVAAGPFANTGLTSNTTYYYVVTAVNAAGESPASIEINAKTLALTGTATATATGTNQINLTWTALAGAVKYNIYRSTTPTISLTTPYTTVTATSFADTGLASATTYYYAIMGIDANGNSVGNVMSVNATTLNINSALGSTTFRASPLSVNDLNNQNNKLIIQFMSLNISNVVGYNIYQTTQLNSTGILQAANLTGIKNNRIAYIPATGLGIILSTYEPGALSANVQYNYLLTAVDNMGVEYDVSKVTSTIFTFSPPIYTAL